MGDIIETVETKIEELRGGTAVTIKDMEKSKKPYLKNIRIAGNGIKKEERRNERLDLEISAAQQKLKLEAQNYKIKVKAITDKIEDLQDAKLANVAEIQDYKDDIAENLEELAVIDDRIEALENQSEK